MKQPIITASLLALGLSLGSAVALASEMEERFREEGKQLDLTGLFNAETDAQSRSFKFGSANVHDFSVTQPGIYRFESRVTAGYSDDYRIAALLEDASGNIIARSEAYGQDGGLAMRQRLGPGDYVLRVEAQRFGTRGRAGDGYSIRISGLDVEGRELAEGVSDGDGIFFTGDSRESSGSVFVRGDSAVATLGAVEEQSSDEPPADKPATGPVQETTAGLAAAAAASTDSAGASQAAEPTGSEAELPARDQTFQTIKTDVKIRARGEVLTFEVAERGTVAITTSTYPTGYEDTYRIELEVLDESGRVVAEGAGQGFDGDVDMETRLAPGRYRIRVQGQKFGSAHSGVNNYELKVQQLDRR
ncbi:hypothetical protein [Halomonas sp. 11-S5]|uniref:hypothetical protein n=1 Tax=Halomonas sp. 11-S5 TaxID=2994064 RepID=UPI002469AA46|nr:hypothetical protein [Halomonas sp. 11-S5]